MTLTTARHSYTGGWGWQSRYLTRLTSDPGMIEVAAFPALVLRLRDEFSGCTAGREVGSTGRKTGAGLCWVSVVLICLPEDTLASWP